MCVQPSTPPTRSAAAFRKPLRIDSPTRREKFADPPGHDECGAASVRASNAWIVPSTSTVIVTAMSCIGEPAGSGPLPQPGRS